MPRFGEMPMMPSAEESEVQPAEDSASEKENSQAREDAFHVEEERKRVEALKEELDLIKSKIQEVKNVLLTKEFGSSLDLSKSFKYGEMKDAVPGIEVSIYRNNGFGLEIPDDKKGKIVITGVVPDRGFGETSRPEFDNLVKHVTISDTESVYSTRESKDIIKREVREKFFDVDKDQFMWERKTISRPSMYEEGLDEEDQARSIEEIDSTGRIILILQTGYSKRDRNAFRMTLMPTSGERVDISTDPEDIFMNLPKQLRDADEKRFNTSVSGVNLESLNVLRDRRFPIVVKDARVTTNGKPDKDVDIRSARVRVENLKVKGIAL